MFAETANNIFNAFFGNTVPTNYTVLEVTEGNLYLPLNFYDGRGLATSGTGSISLEGTVDQINALDTNIINGVVSYTLNDTLANVQGADIGAGNLPLVTGLLVADSASNLLAAAPLPNTINGLAVGQYTHQLASGDAVANGSSIADRFEVTEAGLSVTVANFQPGTDFFSLQNLPTEDPGQVQFGGLSADGTLIDVAVSFDGTDTVIELDLNDDGGVDQTITIANQDVSLQIGPNSFDGVISQAAPPAGVGIYNLFDLENEDPGVIAGLTTVVLVDDGNNVGAAINTLVNGAPSANLQAVDELVSTEGVIILDEITYENVVSGRRVAAHLE